MQNGMSFEHIQGFGGNNLDSRDSEFKHIPDNCQWSSTCGGSAQHSITTIDELNERIADLSTSLEEFALSSKKNDLVVDKYFEKQRQEELALALANAHSETEQERKAVDAFSALHSLHSFTGRNEVSKLGDQGKLQNKYQERSGISDTERNGTKKPMLVELHTYPGFDDKEYTHLPTPHEAIYMLNIVAEAQQDLLYKPQFKVSFVKFLLCKESQAVLHDAFWWHFCHKYQTSSKDQEAMFDRISTNYTSMIIQWTGSMHQDKLFKRYPGLMAQAIYSTYCYSFPASYRQFNSEFRDDLLNLLGLWMVGTKPTPRSWESWNFDDLEPDGMRKGERIQEDAAKSKTLDFEQHLEKTTMVRPRRMSIFSKQRQRKSVAGNNFNKSAPLPDIPHRKKNFTKKEHAKTKPKSKACNVKNLSTAREQVESVTIVTHPSQDPAASQDSVEKAGKQEEGENVNVKKTKVQEDVKVAKKDTKKDASVEKSMKNISSVLGLVENERKKQSCAAGRGPEFSKVVFDIHGRSPLVEHFLQTRSLSKDCGTSILVQRTEIKSLPPISAPTYREMIKTSKSTLDASEVQFKRFMAGQTLERQQCMSKWKQNEKKFLSCTRELLSNPQHVKQISDLLYVAEGKEEPEDTDIRVSKLRNLVAEALEQQQ